jgi:hypothetical protein
MAYSPICVELTRWRAYEAWLVKTASSLPPSQFPHESDSESDSDSDHSSYQQLEESVETDDSFLNNTSYDFNHCSLTRFSYCAREIEVEDDSSESFSSFSSPSSSSLSSRCSSPPSATVEQATALLVQAFASLSISTPPPSPAPDRPVSALGSYLPYPSTDSFPATPWSDPGDAPTSSPTSPTSSDHPLPYPSSHPDAEPDSLPSSPTSSEASSSSQSWSQTLLQRARLSLMADLSPSHPLNWRTAFDGELFVERNLALPRFPLD